MKSLKQTLDLDRSSQSVMLPLSCSTLLLGMIAMGGVMSAPSEYNSSSPTAYDGYSIRRVSSKHLMNETWWSSEAAVVSAVRDALQCGSTAAAVSTHPTELCQGVEVRILTPYKCPCFKLVIANK